MLRSERERRREVAENTNIPIKISLRILVIEGEKKLELMDAGAIARVATKVETNTNTIDRKTEELVQSCEQFFSSVQ